MSENIVQLNEEVTKGQLKELVRDSVEGTLNELLEVEGDLPEEFLKIFLKHLLWQCAAAARAFALSLWVKMIFQFCAPSDDLWKDLNSIGVIPVCC